MPRLGRLCVVVPGVNRVPMPISARTVVMSSDENARPKPSVTLPVPSSRGTLNDCASVEMSRLDVIWSSIGPTLLLMNFCSELCTAFLTVPVKKLCTRLMMKPQNPEPFRLTLPTVHVRRADDRGAHEAALERQAEVDRRGDRSPR